MPPWCRPSPYVYDPETEEESHELVGQIDNADLKRTTLTHTGKRVEVTGVFTNLTRSGLPGLSSTCLSPPTPGARWVYASGGDNYPYAYFGADRGDGECTGLKSSVSRKEETLTVSAPRNCLQSPTWV